MKKFDLEAAKNGDAVCLRDGTPAKILDFDFRSTDGSLIMYKYYDIDYHIEINNFADRTGRCTKIFINGDAKKYDLFMAPVYAYANIYKDPINEVLSTKYIHQTFKAAKENRQPDKEDREFFCHARIEMFYDEGNEGGEDDGQ